MNESDVHTRIAQLEGAVEQLQNAAIALKSRDHQMRKLVAQVEALVGVLDNARLSVEQMKRMAGALERLADQGIHNRSGDGDALTRISTALERIADGQPGHAVDKDPTRAKVYATVPKLLEALGRPADGEADPVAFPPSGAAPALASPPTDPQKLRPQETARLQGSGLELVSAIRVAGAPAPIIGKSANEVVFHVPLVATAASEAELEVDVDGDPLTTVKVPIEQRQTNGREAAGKAV
jgi:hypothetical protein